MLEPEGATPPEIGDHPFVAYPWWERCDRCGLAMPAHFEIDSVCFEAMLAEIASHRAAMLARGVKV